MVKEEMKNTGTQEGEGCGEWEWGEMMGEMDAERSVRAARIREIGERN